MPDNNKISNISRHIFAEFFENADASQRLPLTAEERELSANLYPIVVDLVEKNLKVKLKKKNDYKDPDFKERLELTRGNLKTIIMKFSDSVIACQKFMDTFEPFVENRVENILELRKLAEALNKDRQNCNISQITGSASGAVGCAVIASSFIFPPVGVILSIVGGITAGVGALVAAGTTVTEGVLVSQNVSQAQDILKKDEKEFEKFEGLFTHSIEFVAAVEAVLSIDLMKRFGECLRGLVCDAADFYDKFQKSIGKCLKLLCKLGNDFISLLAPLLPAVVTTICVLFLLRKNKLFIYDVMMLTSNLFYTFTNGLELGVEVARIIGQIFMRGGMRAVGQMPANVARIVFHGVFAGLGMALDIINIIYSAVDLSRGSISEHATKINKAADVLEKELNLLWEIHDGIEAILGHKST